MPRRRQDEAPASSQASPSKTSDRARKRSSAGSINRQQQGSGAPASRRGKASRSERRLKGCPLTSAHYEEALHYHRPPSKSRLYTGVRDIVEDNKARASLLSFVKGTAGEQAVKFLHDAYRVHELWKGKPNSPRDGADGLPHQQTLLDNYFGAEADPLPIPPETQVKLTTRPDEHSLRAAMSAVEAAVRQQFLSAFLSSAAYASYCSDILTGPDLRVEDVVHNDEVMMVFMQFLEKHKASVVIDFWLLADNFTNTYPAAPAEEITQDALGIYNRFFSLQSPDPLGVDEDTRTAVEANICRDDGAPRGCFAEPDHLVYTALRLHYFPLFIESEEFAHYLAELSKRGASAESQHEHAGASGAGVAGKLIRKYSHAPSRLGYVDRWGEFIRDAAVAMEPTLDSDPLLAGHGGGLGSRMKNAFIGKSRTTSQEELLQAWDSAKSMVKEIREEMFKTGVLYRPQLA